MIKKSNVWYLNTKCFRIWFVIVCSTVGSGAGVGNSLVTGEFPAQRASNAENVSIWWRHHNKCPFCIADALLVYCQIIYIIIVTYFKTTRDLTTSGGNPRYNFLGGRNIKTSQKPMFLHIATRVCGRHWHTWTWKQWDSMFKSNKSSKEMSGNSRLQKHRNMFIDFIWLNVQAKYLIQTILYPFKKWDMALWKWPKCPQYMQRTWRQTATTQHTGLT